MKEKECKIGKDLHLTTIDTEFLLNTEELKFKESTPKCDNFNHLRLLSSDWLNSRQITFTSLLPLNFTFLGDCLFLFILDNFYPYFYKTRIRKLDFSKVRLFLLKISCSHVKRRFLLIVCSLQGLLQFYWFTAMSYSNCLRSVYLLSVANRLHNTKLPLVELFLHLYIL